MRPARILMTNVTCWPEVRRGSERLLHEHACWQAAAGHDVTVMATHRGPRMEHVTEGVRHVLLPRWPSLGRLDRWIGPWHAFVWQVRREVRAAERDGRRYDVAHCLNYHDALGVLLSGPGRPFLAYHVVGIPVRAYFRRIPHDGMAFRHVVKAADRCAVVSRHAGAMLAAEFGRQATLLPSPSDLRLLHAARKPARDGVLRLLFVGDADEPRKGAALLVRAFARVRAIRPDAELEFGGPASEATIRALLALARPEDRAALRFTGVGTPEELPLRYARATVLVHPAIWEAQGMVLVEALACGTPVVACDHGGVPEIVDDPRIGRLFRPGPIERHAATDDAALAEAILAAAALADDPQTEQRCRDRAAPFGWAALGPAYDALLTPGLEPDAPGKEIAAAHAGAARFRDGAGWGRTHAH